MHKRWADRTSAKKISSGSDFNLEKARFAGNIAPNIGQRNDYYHGRFQRLAKTTEIPLKIPVVSHLALVL
jgi:hypothetical protein